MLSNTFQDISIESKRKYKLRPAPLVSWPKKHLPALTDLHVCDRWQLLRASIIVKLDKGMSDEERSRSHTGGEIFWKWEQHPNGMVSHNYAMTREHTITR